MAALCALTAAEAAGVRRVVLTSSVSAIIATEKPVDNYIYGASLELVGRVLSGKDMALPQSGFPVVNVRDVAAMPVRALKLPETNGERIASVAGWLWFKDISEVLVENFPHRKIPTMIAPNTLIKLFVDF